MVKIIHSHTHEARSKSDFPSHDNLSINGGNNTFKPFKILQEGDTQAKVDLSVLALKILKGRSSINILAR